MIHQNFMDFFPSTLRISKLQRNAVVSKGEQLKKMLAEVCSGFSAYMALKKEKLHRLYSGGRGEAVKSEPQKYD